MFPWKNIQDKYVSRVKFKLNPAPQTIGWCGRHGDEILSIAALLRRAQPAQSICIILLSTEQLGSAGSIGKISGPDNNC